VAIEANRDADSAASFSRERKSGLMVQPSSPDKYTKE